MSNKSMKASIVIGGTVSSAFRSAMSTTKNGLKAIGGEIANVERRQRLLGQSINTFGRVGRNVDKLRQEYAELTRQADKLRAAQSRLADVQSRMDANTARRREAGGRFAGAVAGFGVVAAATLAPVRAAASFENAMLGVAKQVEGARDAGGNLTGVYFDMAKQIQQLGREIPLRTNDIADMVAAGARMGVAREELVSFSRTAAMMADAFEMPAGALADDMGKIAGLFKIPIPRIGELADAINFLDDNAKSTGGDIINVMRRIGGMAETLKMPAREAAALGSTFLTLGSSAEVAATASNAVMRILATSTAQSKRVRTGLESIGMSPAAVQASMASDPTGTILRLLDTLNKLNREQRVVASTRIFGAEYGDDIAKLSTGAEEYRRQLELVASGQAKGSMSREFQSRLKTTGAQWQITKNRMTEVAVTIGDALKPAVNSLMQSAGPMFDGFSTWTRANPGMVKGIVGTALALAGLRVVTTGAAFAWAALKTPVLAVMGFIARWRATHALATMGKFGPVAMRAASAMRMIGVAIAAIGGGPIAAAVAAITVGALVVRKYWQPIAAWIAGVFDGIRTAVAPAFAEFGAAIAPLRPLWDGITSAVSGAWGWFMKLIQPVNMTSEQLKSATESGRSFGSVVGAVISFVVRRITSLVSLIGMVGRKLGGLASAAASLPGFSHAAAAVQSLFGGGGAPVEPPAPEASPRVGRIAPPSPVTAPRVGRPAPPAPEASPRVGRIAPPSPPAASRAGRAAPPAPPMANRGGGTVTVQQSNSYQITQQPGESGEDLARRIARHTQQQDAIAQRGSLADAA